MKQTFGDISSGYFYIPGERNRDKKIDKKFSNAVKKYASEITTSKKITPHKLRSTYGTALYQETGDIYLVADVLGHKDVNTARKHYAAMEEDRRRSAAQAVRLREQKKQG